MNIIICGAGRVGFTIAKILSEQSHSITVIDQSSEDIQKIDDSLDVKAIVGKATYPSILEKANASEADMLNLCCSKLGNFKSPDRIYFLNDLPKGPSGKIQRIKLLELLHV